MDYKINAISGPSSAVSATKANLNYEETKFIISLEKQMLLPFIEFVLPIFILLFINIVLEYDKSDFGTQLASIISLILS